MPTASTGVPRSGATARAPQPCARHTVSVRIGSFNVGLLQAMIKKSNRVKNLAALQRVANTCCVEGALNIFSMSEVGGHKKGLSAAGITFETAFPQSTEHGALFRMNQNYMTSWNLNGSVAQPTEKISVASSEPEVLLLDSAVAEPQLVVLVFSVFFGAAYIVHGKSLLYI